MEVKTLGVIGAGQMGSGIAQVAAAKGSIISKALWLYYRLLWGIFY